MQHPAITIDQFVTYSSLDQVLVYIPIPRQHICLQSGNKSRYVQGIVHPGKIHVQFRNVWDIFPGCNMIVPVKWGMCPILAILISFRLTIPLLAACRSFELPSIGMARRQR
jgi:hypothetical protein